MAKPIPDARMSAEELIALATHTGPLLDFEFLRRQTHQGNIATNSMNLSEALRVRARDINARQNIA